MAEMSRHFNFDSFNDWLTEVDDENTRVMELIKPSRIPGEIGAVAIVLSTETEPEPPEAA